MYTSSLLSVRLIYDQYYSVDVVLVKVPVVYLRFPMDFEAASTFSRITAKPTRKRKKNENGDCNW